MMRWISTTIKRMYLDKILSGEKKIEYKGETPFWEKRLRDFCGSELTDVGINFICGRESVKFRVNCVTYCTRREKKVIDGKEYDWWYEIHLGEQIG